MNCLEPTCLLGPALPGLKFCSKHLRHYRDHPISQTQMTLFIAVALAQAAQKADLQAVGFSHPKQQNPVKCHNDVSGRPVNNDEKVTEKTFAKRKHFSQNKRKQVQDRYPHCYLCEELIDFSLYWEIDHVVPLKDGIEAGGTNDIGNLVATHEGCNQFKGTHSYQWARVKYRDLPLKRQKEFQKQRPPIRKLSTTTSEVSF